jgi:hypothetical protein
VPQARASCASSRNKIFQQVELTPAGSTRLHRKYPFLPEGRGRNGLYKTGFVEAAHFWGGHLLSSLRTHRIANKSLR